MAKIPLYNLRGESAGTIELADAVFGVKPKESVIHQVFTALRANARRPWAHTKDRGDVRGGGKKPWKQKGTGRARHGSIRSPIWKGGGVTFGPLSVRNYTQKVNKKMNQAAVRMCLSGRIKDQKFVAVESLPTDGKTKAVATLRRALPGAGRSTLVLTAATDAMVLRATRNIPRIDLVRAQDVSVVDLLSHQYVIATADALRSLEKRLSRVQK